MTPELVRCAVLGSPIAHSLSPALHRAAYAELGLVGWSYDAYDVGAADLPAFVAGLDRYWRGLSLTMPLKEAVMALGRPDPVARLVGVGNTLVLAPGRRTEPAVHNTDVGGLVWALRRAGLTAPRRVTVLGSGATARSALVSAAQLGVAEVVILARRVEAGRALAPLAVQVGVRLTVRPWSSPVPATDALLSTVTRGVADDRAAELAGSAPVVFDAVYEPWPTALAAAAERAGGRLVSGLDLLVGQALLQIELMTGFAVEPGTLYRAGQAELATRTA